MAGKVVCWKVRAVETASPGRPGSAAELVLLHEADDGSSSVDDAAVVTGPGCRVVVVGPECEVDRRAALGDGAMGAVGVSGSEGGCSAEVVVMSRGRQVRLGST